MIWWISWIIFYKNTFYFRVHFRPKTEQDDEIIKNIETAEATKTTEAKEPEKKIAKVDQMDTSGSISASNTTTGEKPPKSEVATSSKSIERLPCGAKPVFADFKFDNAERYARYPMQLFSFYLQILAINSLF